MTKWVWVAALAAAPSAWAAGTIPDSPVKQDTSDHRYAHDLDSGDKDDRLFAARVLLRRVKEATRVGSRNSSDMRVVEARQRLEDFDRLIAPKCIRLLTTKNIARPCARMLGLLETEAAIEPLQDLIAADPGFCTKRTAEWALRRIETSS
jgi:HEAT repeat protein